MDRVEEPLSRLEFDVLQRIARYRGRWILSTAVALTLVLSTCVLMAGLRVGLANARHNQRPIAAESVVLGEDASSTPARLLAPAILLTERR